jgi:hypothetical protein
MAALANVLALFAIPGPLNIQFGLTAIPILLVALALGPRYGAICGLLGGVVQATKYGHLLYVFYTAIQGGVAGYFAFRITATKRMSPVFGLIGGAFLLFWVDLLRESPLQLAALQASFRDAPRVFGAGWSWPSFPAVSISGAVCLGALLFIVARGATRPGHDLRLRSLAGIYGAIAYVPFDAWVLYSVQGYPWIPTWFVLGKDLAQDFIAAILCATLLSNHRIAHLLEYITSTSDGPGA